MAVVLRDKPKALSFTIKVYFTHIYIKTFEFHQVPDIRTKVYRWSIDEPGYEVAQISISIGGERCHGSKLTNSLGKQQLELLTRT